MLQTKQLVTSPIAHQTPRCTQARSPGRRERCKLGGHASCQVAHAHHVLGHVVQLLGLHVVHCSGKHVGKLEATCGGTLRGQSALGERCHVTGGRAVLGADPSLLYIAACLSVLVYYSAVTRANGLVFCCSLLEVRCLFLLLAVCRVLFGRTVVSASGSLRFICGLLLVVYCVLFYADLL